MGLRKLGDETKVTKMKIVPMSEKQDATRSVVSSALNSPGVKECMVGWDAQRVWKSDQCSCSQKETACICSRAPRVLAVGLGRGKRSRDTAVSIFG